MLEALFEPKTIAVVGASRTPGKLGHELVANLLQGGFQGEIVPVNPSADEILGLKCYPDPKAFGKPVDLAILAAPPARFDEYELQIRREYSWVDDRTYRDRRAKILRAFRDREWIYVTDFFRSRFETRARDNLERSLSRLVL